jgi:hypothetical protein
VLEVVDRVKPLHSRWGRRSWRYRELETLAAAGETRDSRPGCHQRVPTWVPPGLARGECGIDGLQAEHDVRRAPTYDRILKTSWPEITIHCTLTGQMMKYGFCASS